MQFDSLAEFWPITQDPKFCQICWWNINSNISFHFRLFSIKTNMTKFFKKSKELYFGAILSPFCSNLGKNEFSWKKGLRQFFNIQIIYHCAKNQKNLMSYSWENCWRDSPKSSFISLISLSDTTNFRVLQLIEKSCNLIGQEHFGPYLRNQNFPKYEICSSIQQLQ